MLINFSWEDIRVPYIDISYYRPKWMRRNYLVHVGVTFSSISWALHFMQLEQPKSKKKKIYEIKG